MTTTCQFIVDRATSFSTLNRALTSDRAEMLSRIRADQQALFTSTADLTRDRYKAATSLASTVGSSGRAFELEPSTPIAPPIERVLQLKLGDGREASQVDELDVDAEYAPRYFVRGTRLIEVLNDWSSTAGAVTATLLYVYGMTDIDPAGQLTQAVSVPDRWIDVLVLPLAMYLHQKDPGRDAKEYDRLATMMEDRYTDYLAFLGHFGGVESRRFWLPTPPESKKQ